MNIEELNAYKKSAKDLWSSRIRRRQDRELAGEVARERAQLDAMAALVPLREAVAQLLLGCATRMSVTAVEPLSALSTVAAFEVREPGQHVIRVTAVKDIGRVALYRLDAAGRHHEFASFTGAPMEDAEAIGVAFAKLAGRLEAHHAHGVDMGYVKEEEGE